MTTATRDARELASTLADLIGPDRVVASQSERELYSSDVYARGVTAELAIRPTDRETLPEAVRLITEAGFAVAPRGGGMSYTGGYLPVRERTVVLDLAGLNRIVELSEEDMLITVEAGVTWQQIHEALKPRGLRLPFFGTFSGSLATVGGGLSNGALFMGTARHGTSAEIVVGLELVTARGRLLRTGQGAFRNARPGYRNYGPDLTGLFVHDAGALGVKTLATLRVMRDPADAAYASLAFSDQAAAVRALSDIARSGVTEEVYLFDPATTARSLEPGSFKRDLLRLKHVMEEQHGLLKSLREGARLVASGRGFVDTSLYTLHFVCAGRSAAAVEADLASGRELARAAGGVDIANTIPKAARANPFEPLNGILGADGERWAALNAKVRHSEAPALIAATERMLEPYRARMTELGVSMSFLYIGIDRHVFSYEPVLRWYDEWLPLHRDTPEPSYLARLTEPPPNPEARVLVGEIRRGIVGLFADFGAASNQIGKTYPLLGTMLPEARALLTALKAELDPDGLMNPGALGTFGADPCT